LFRKTYLEEQKQREREQSENDLIMIEDPNEIQRRNTIQRIQSLYNEVPQSSGVVYRWEMETDKSLLKSFSMTHISIRTNNRLIRK
jgi:hypothetical protein